jgi:hypothetical protein
VIHRSFKNAKTRSANGSSAGRIAVQDRRGWRWGKWRLQPGNRTLVLDDPTPQYQIDLDRITNGAHLLDWIFQIQKKSWSNSKMVGDLVAAFQDLFDPQANGAIGTVDPVQHLRNLRRRRSWIADQLKRSAPRDGR